MSEFKTDLSELDALAHELAEKSPEWRLNNLAESDHLRVEWAVSEITRLRALADEMAAALGKIEGQDIRVYRADGHRCYYQENLQSCKDIARAALARKKEQVTHD